MKHETKVQDIQSYTIFANIDDRKGKIKGHMILLDKEQIEAIEDIVLSKKVRVKDEYSYELEDDTNTDISEVSDETN